jgi:ribosome-associated toxin RatA of RatAB toxin-antitoxin module
LTTSSLIPISCRGARIEVRQGDVMDASLELHKGGLRKRFKTRNTRQFPTSIELELLGGPFRHLSGGWRFADIGEQGSKVSLELAFEFESTVLDMMLGSFFEDTCNKLVDAFTQRATDVYDTE